MTMKKSGINDELMIRYLLGQLPEEEQVRLEEQFFTDDESYQQLLALEDELRFDYARGELTAIERSRFKQRFLLTDEDRKKLAFAGALISQVAVPDAGVRSEVNGTTTRPIPWWRKFSDLLPVQNPVLRYSFAATVLVVLLGGAWLVFERFRTGEPREMAGREQPPHPAGTRDRVNDAPVSVQTPPQEAIVEQRPPQQSSPDPARPEQRTVPSVATFLLPPGLVRGAGGPKQLVLPRGTDRVRLGLSLRRKSEHTSYRAVIQTLEGVEVWKRSGLSARGAGRDQAVVAELPTRLLAAGDYELVVQGATRGGGYEDVDEYYFRIVKK